MVRGENSWKIDLGDMVSRAGIQSLAKHSQRHTEFIKAQFQISKKSIWSFLITFKNHFWSSNNLN